jgi:hypothetical protein
MYIHIYVCIYINIGQHLSPLPFHNEVESESFKSLDMEKFNINFAGNSSGKYIYIHIYIYVYMEKFNSTGNSPGNFSSTDLCIYIYIYIYVYIYSKARRKSIK